jgi:hypothetical protein
MSANEAKYVFGSLTRNSSLADEPFEVVPLDRDDWAAGDFVVGKVEGMPGNYPPVELHNGRLIAIARGDLLVGALGVRHATLEVTGSWELIGEDGRMRALTGAGLFGKMTSKSPFSPTPVPLRYVGHTFCDGSKVTMHDSAKRAPRRTYRTPTVLLVGTSMSAGKTTTARIVIRQLRRLGLTVLGAKLAGAARYRDVLTMADAGAARIFDFVDVGLPSTVCPSVEYRESLSTLLSLMAEAATDVAVVEIGASPLEPYNGSLAIEAIRGHIKCTILCASDPYAVYGVMKAYRMRPDVVTGIATNTLAGIELIEKLCGVRAINLLDSGSLPLLSATLERTLGLTHGPTP